MKTRITTLALAMLLLTACSQTAVESTDDVETSTPEPQAQVDEQPTEAAMTLTGTYSYNEMLGKPCLKLSEPSSALPEGESVVCFSNADAAKAALEMSSGAVTVTVEGLDVAGEDYVDGGKVMAMFVSVQN